MNKNIFITGGTGYIGSRVIPLLIQKGFKIKGLIRKGSEKKLPKGVEPVLGNALNSKTFISYVNGCDIFIHLIGVSHPGPGKEKEFNEIDKVSVEEAVKAVLETGVKLFIYLSVAEPAPFMKEFINIRKYGEKIISDTGINAVFIKPWYVLGPGHYWPYIILPIYWLFFIIPPFKDAAKRLYPVKLKNVLNAIVHSAENPPTGILKLSTKDLKKF
ncbi:MAG: NAD(P)H-binding protein [Ignavibacteria bacterium]|nr:NAD(P)H-binding protein [Ignavibacteria bacterium]